MKILPVVITGQIRVFQSRDDREVLLYYVEPGQTCMMSLSACFFNSQSPSQAVATCNTVILAVPVRFISIWQKKYDSWNNFVIRTFRIRYDELLETVEGLAFQNVRERLLHYFDKEKQKVHSRGISVSHHQLANELGTTRVVISRILKQLENEGRLKLYRGTIELS